MWSNYRPLSTQPKNYNYAKLREVLSKVVPSQRYKLSGTIHRIDRENNGAKSIINSNPHPEN